MGIIFLIITALFVLSFLVVIHEFGHFLAAKAVGVWPEEFGIGLPPKVWGKKYKGTLWSLNALPLGGFVRLHGEVGTDVQKYPEKAFMNKSRPARAFVAVAGVFMNFLYAVIAFSFIFYITGIPQGVRISEISENSPAAEAGITVGSLVTAVDGKELYNPALFSQIIADTKGRETSVAFVNVNGETSVKTFVMRSTPPEGEGLFGVKYSYGATEVRQPQGFSRFTESVYYGARQTFDFSKLILSEFGKLLKTLFSGHVPQGLAGPLGVVGVTAEAARNGFLDLLGFSALISINLAVINLVPFPPLDGSRVLFLLIEMIVGKKRLPVWEARIHQVGMYFLLGVMLLLTVREIPKAFTAGSLTNFVQSLVK
jgi:regulator of sigma E protease